jgi:1-deoxy-D-xylulose-5-phosphate synthase
MNSEDKIKEVTGEPLLAKVNSPADIRGMSVSQLEELAGEIRELVINTVAANGGHLAPNLGAVELTMALHYVFNTPEDKLVWDVGHQAYIHKIITGRRDFFKTLRQFDGCLGFLAREESEYDCFGAGHAGTAISAAVGMAAAAEKQGQKHKVVAVIGDGALNCGISLEGLNSVRDTTRDLIIVLNDNKMSISENVGAIPSYLNRIISGRGYNRFKALAKMMLKKVPHASEIHRKIQRLEEATKSMFLPGVFFEELGIRYIGPINGHDFNELIRTFEAIKEFHRPVLVHVITEKGHGYSPAEAAPEKYHGLSAFDPETGECKCGSGISFSSAFGKTMLEIAAAHKNLAVITPAMSAGTGLSEFAAKYPEKFFDVGIAEEHAVVFAAGLAAGGMRPVVAMYCTFLQRALDCVFHDVCLQNLPVIFCLDRAGIVEDGPTHHGIHDLSFLRAIPNLTVMMPKDENELRSMIHFAWQMKLPVAIRYPRGCSGAEFEMSAPVENIAAGRAEILGEGADVALWGCGRETYTALKTAELLEKEYNISATVVNTRFIRPFDNELLKAQAAVMPVVTIEDSQTCGGFASQVDEELINFQHKGIKHFGWGKQIVPHGAIETVREHSGFTPAGMADEIAKWLEKAGAN